MAELGEPLFLETSTFILLMEETLHQLIKYSIIYRVLYTPGGCLGFFSIKKRGAPGLYRGFVGDEKPTE